MTVQTDTPEAVVQRQLDAYNARDMQAFLDTYTDDVAVYNHPDTLILQGHAAMRERYTKTFADPALLATIPKRIVMGEYVIDHECCRRTLETGVDVVNLAVIYQVTKGKISKVWFLRSPAN